MSKNELEQMLDIIRQMQCDIYALQSRLLEAINEGGERQHNSEIKEG
jgi:hypothetical protein